MPKKKFQELIYGVLMTFFMVLAMELYNTGLRMGGLTNAGFPIAFQEMAIMFPICFVMGFFLHRQAGAENRLSDGDAWSRSPHPDHCRPCFRHCRLHVSHYEFLGYADL